MAVTEGLAAIAQGYINKGVAGNLWFREPKLSFIAQLGGEFPKGPDGLNIGRPMGAVVFKGLRLQKVERAALVGVSSFRPKFIISNPSNIAILGSKDVSTQLPNWQSPGATQADMYGEATVNWTGMLDEEILIPREYYNRALDRVANGEGIALTELVTDCTRMAQSNVLSKIAYELQSGTPTDQDADPMDHFIGWGVWFSATNYCAGVDRSQAKNTQWQALVDATAYAPSAVTLIDAANGAPNYLQDKSEDGARALFVNWKCFKVMKAEVLGLGWTQMTTTLPEMAQAGATNMFALQKDNCYIVYDRRVPANTAYCITPATWMFRTHPKYTFRVSPFTNLWETKRGGEQALMAHVETKGMLVCTNPGLNVIFNGFTDPS